MRSTSSARRSLSALLCLLLAVEWTAAPALSAAETREEPCLLLRLHSPSVPEEFARKWLDPMPGLLRDDLQVRWVSAPTVPPEPGDSAARFPEPGDADIDRVSGKIAEALRRMDAMETRAAAALLSEAEAEARKFRAGKTLRPYLAEIFLRRGVLLLWEGKRKEAEGMFARSRLLRPNFTPDPALFSPAFRESWSRSGERRPPDPEIIVHSLPPGAAVSLDGKPVGTTPGRFRVRPCEPVRIRIALPGYRETETTGQWLPGDSEEIERRLVRDRAASLRESIVSRPDGKGTGESLAEMAKSAGASRVALLVLERKEHGNVLKVLSSRGDGADPAFLGEIRLSSTGEDVEETAKKASGLLAAEGWPTAKPGRVEKEAKWYHSKWFWVLIGAVAIGAAAASAGGGGSGGGSGGSTGSIGVTF